MHAIVFAFLLALAQDKPAEKRPQVCFESLNLYEDTDFTKKMAEDSMIGKAYKEKMPKYVKMVKTEVAKALAEKGIELVECPNHRLEGSGLPQVAAEAKPLHIRVSLAHDMDIITITIYAKFELCDGDKAVVSVKGDRTFGVAKVMDRKKRKEIIISFAGKMVRDMSDKLKEHLKNKK